MAYEWSDATVVIEHSGFKITEDHVCFGLRTAAGQHLLFRMKSHALKRMALALLLTAGTAHAVETMGAGFAQVEADIVVEQVAATVNSTMEFGVLALGGGELGAGSITVPISEESIKMLLQVLPRILQAIGPPQTA